jgi:hypothetical protein
MLARKIIMVLALLATATTLATTGAFAAAGNHSGYLRADYRSRPVRA